MPNEDKVILCDVKLLSVDFIRNYKISVMKTNDILYVFVPYLSPRKIQRYIYNDLKNKNYILFF